MQPWSTKDGRLGGRRDGMDGRMVGMTGCAVLRSGGHSRRKYTNREKGTGI